MIESSATSKIEKGERCENCGETMKILHYSWGEGEQQVELITNLSTILEEDEILKEPFEYDRLNIEYCEKCGAVNLELR